MSVLGVAEAAAELGVSERRVRQMLGDGQLRGQHVGRAWIIERHALEEVRENRPEVGRPWHAQKAWAFLLLAEGRDVALSAVDRSRVSRRVEAGVEQNLGRLRARAQKHSFYAHPSVLEQLIRHPDIVRSGISAIDEYSIDLIAQQVVEGYIRQSDVGGLIEQVALDESSDRPNVILRVVRDDAWPFDAHQAVAPKVVVAVDLLDANDERSQRAGRALLAKL